MIWIMIININIYFKSLITFCLVIIIEKLKIYFCDYNWILYKIFENVNIFRLSGSLIRKLGSKKCDIFTNVTFFELILFNFFPFVVQQFYLTHNRKKQNINDAYCHCFYHFRQTKRTNYTKYYKCNTKYNSRPFSENFNFNFFQRFVYSLDWRNCKEYPNR